MLALQEVTKSFGELRVLKNVSLSFLAGQTHVLIGPSGCGKSTVLRLLIGLVQPDRGQVLFDGENLDRLNVQKMRHRFGYVIQEGGLFPHLTGAQNVALLGRFLGQSEDEMVERVNELAMLVHLDADLLKRYPREMSGGQRQRVSLMRALFMDPDVLLLDEPLGALDPMIRSELQDELKEIFTSLRKTVVLVTHDLSEAAHFADQVVLLDRGTVAQRGSAKELFVDPASDFVRRFVRAQSFTLFDGNESMVANAPKDTADREDVE